VPYLDPDEHASSSSPSPRPAEILDQVHIPKGSPVAVLGYGNTRIAGFTGLQAERDAEVPSMESIATKLLRYPQESLPKSSRRNSPIAELTTSLWTPQDPRQDWNPRVSMCVPRGTVEYDHSAGMSRSDTSPSIVNEAPWSAHAADDSRRPALARVRYGYAS